MAASSEPRSRAISTRAIRPDALAHAEPALARHQLHRRRLAQIVAIVLEPLAHLDDVAMALGGQQADPGALVLEQRVGRHRRAVHDPLGARQHGRAIEPERLRPADRGPSITPSDWSAGVEATLAMRDTALRRRRTTRSVNVPPTSMPIRSTPQRPSAETKPSALSRARAPPRCAAPARPSRRPRPNARGARRRASARCRSPWS